MVVEEAGDHADADAPACRAPPCLGQRRVTFRHKLAGHAAVAGLRRHVVLVLVGQIERMRLSGHDAARSLVGKVYSFVSGLVS
jgi:hypothetical protein